MITYTHPSCIRCRFWELDGIWQATSTRFGECHRGPPIGNNTWPITDEDKWCGEWKSKEARE